MTYTQAGAASLAMTLLEGVEPRRTHVRGVGELAESAHRKHPDLVAVGVVAAAWLHDVGYASLAVKTGFHPFDGANFLRSRGWSPQVCNLVAFHTGSETEAEERGIEKVLISFERPSEPDLDMLTLFDLSVGPEGQSLSPKERVNEILHRYEGHDPVHRAVRRSGRDLIESANRARKRLAQGC
ncbi:HD domain-containing protein [Janibacter sp. Soil728]|uniref:HD domain-containing protein n=1 Tax=Janibacter sp. Soil728 TaxID=1736393 RepID=UPI0009E86B5C|nr:HD domain-containing protein [Janibacter sp. Soil728]